MTTGSKSARFEVYQVYADGNPERVATFPTAHQALQRRAQLESARLTYPPAYFVRDSLDDERTVEDDQ